MKAQNNVKDYIHEGFILSIGPQTDAILEHFELSDALVPRLRNLAQTVRSGRWEAALHSAEWGLSSEQAAILSDALLSDTQANDLSISLPKVSLLLSLFILHAYILSFQSRSTHWGKRLSVSVIITLFLTLIAHCFLVLFLVLFSESSSGY